MVFLFLGHLWSDRCYGFFKILQELGGFVTTTIPESRYFILLFELFSDADSTTRLAIFLFLILEDDTVHLFIVRLMRILLACSYSVVSASLDQWCLPEGKGCQNGCAI